MAFHTRKQSRSRQSPTSKGLESQSKLTPRGQRQDHLVSIRRVIFNRLKHSVHIHEFSTVLKKKKKKKLLHEVVPPNPPNHTWNWSKLWSWSPVTGAAAGTEQLATPQGCPRWALVWGPLYTARPWGQESRGEVKGAGGGQTGSLGLADVNSYNSYKQQSLPVQHRKLFLVFCDKP